jgi:hypothetical protein
MATKRGTRKTKILDVPSSRKHARAKHRPRHRDEHFLQLRNYLLEQHPEI